jgi:hypothetical protein
MSQSDFEIQLAQDPNAMDTELDTRNAAKRLRSAVEGAADAGRSEATNNSTYTPISTTVFQPIQEAAAKQIQPAVSAVIALKMAAAAAEKRRDILAKHKEDGTFPKFILDAAPGLVLQYDCDCKEQQSTADTALVVYKTALLDCAIQAADKQVQSAAQEYSGTANLLAQQQLATAFDCMPPAWASLPEVQAIRREQQLMFEWELHKAESNVAQKLSEEAKRLQKKQAAAAAAAVESGPVSLEQQVEQCVKQSVEKELKKQLPTAIATAAKGSNSNGQDKSKKGKQQQSAPKTYAEAAGANAAANATVKKASETAAKPVKPSKPPANTAAAGTTGAKHQQQQRNKAQPNYKAKQKGNA